MPQPLPLATVYLIDDEECVRRSMGRLFRSAGLECCCFSSVDEFLAACSYQDRTCVVSDIRMPGRDALELPRCLEEKGCRIPVVFLTAYDTSENREAARRAGAAGYFRKPVDDQALLDAVEWALSSIKGEAPREEDQSELASSDCEVPDDLPPKIQKTKEP